MVKQKMFYMPLWDGMIHERRLDHSAKWWRNSTRSYSAKRNNYVQMLWHLFSHFNAKKNINLDLVCCGVLCFVISITAQCFNFIFCCDYLTRLSIMVSMLACPRCSELPSEWLSNRFFMMAMVCSTNCVLVSLMGTWKNGKPQRKCQ